MPISRFLDGGAFGPDDVKVMTNAFDDALRELKLTDRADPLTEMVAQEIVEAARLGERDPVKLRDVALRSIRK
jgi:hypothetical protein